jgi:hypothetical protein
MRLSARTSELQQHCCMPIHLVSRLRRRRLDPPISRIPLSAKARAKAPKRASQIAGCAQTVGWTSHHERTCHDHLSADDDPRPADSGLELDAANVVIAFVAASEAASRTVRPLPWLYERLASARWGGAQASSRSPDCASRQPHGTAWKDITPLARNEFICWVDDAKQTTTRARRIRRTQEELQDGQRRPCCWPGCKHRARTGT